VQGRVLLALMLREARTRYGRRRLGYLWALIEPLIHIALLSAMFPLLGRAAPLGDNVPTFLATGLVLYFCFQHVRNRTQGGYGSNEALLSFPIIKVIDVFVGRALLEVATWFTVSFIILGTLIATGYSPMPHSVLTMLAAFFALFSIGFGIGTCIGIVAQFMPSISNLLTAPSRILYFASGIFYLPDSLPPLGRDILSWNPILHGITLFREGYFEMYQSHMLSREYLFGWAIGSLLAALMAERVARRAIRNLP
jgi:capsular polysaccharide transport system permease protein